MRIVLSFRGKRVYIIIIPIKNTLVGLGNNLIIISSLFFNNILKLELTLE